MDPHASKPRMPPMHSPQPEDWLDAEIASLRDAVEGRTSRNGRNHTEAIVAEASVWPVRGSGRATLGHGRSSRFGVRRRLALARWVVQRHLPGLVGYGVGVAVAVVIAWLFVSHV
jgi:hypothetical protein